MRLYFRLFTLILITSFFSACHSQSPEECIGQAGRALFKNDFSDWSRSFTADSRFQSEKKFAEFRRKWERRRGEWTLGIKVLVLEENHRRAPGVLKRLERTYEVPVMEQESELFRVQVVCKKELLASVPVQLAGIFGEGGPGWNVTKIELGADIRVSPVQCLIRQIIGARD